MAVRDLSPDEFDPSFFTPADDGGDSGFDPSFFEPAPLNTYRESGDALRLRQEFQREQEQQPDESTFGDNVALGVGQGYYGLKSALGGLFNLAGLTGYGRSLQANARASSAELQDTTDTLSGQNPTTGSYLSEYVGNMAAQQAPSLIAARLLGPWGAAIVGGAQEAGSTQTAAEQAYQAQGMSPDEATARARFPALLNGAITMAITKSFPGHAAEGGALTGGTVWQIARNVAKEIGLEEGEEGLNALANAAVAKFTYDPDKPLNETLTEAWESAGWGGLMAGAMGTVGAGLNRAAANRVQEQQTGMNLRQPVQPPLPPPVAPLTQADIDQANRLNAVAQLTRAESERLGQQAAAFDPSEFEVISEPAPILMEGGDENATRSAQDGSPINAGDHPAENTGPIPVEEIVPRLTAGMQSRSMDISPADFQGPERTLQAMLGPQAPSWKKLAEAGVVQATPNQDGTVNVRVAPTGKQSLQVQNQPTTNTLPISNETPTAPAPVAPTPPPAAIPTPPVAANLATTETAAEPVKSDAQRQYEGEVANFKQSSRDFQKARRQYRDRKINEKSFLAASKSLEQAQAKMTRAENTYQKALKAEAQSGKPERAPAEPKYKRPPDIEDFMDGKIRRVAADDTSDFAEQQRIAESEMPDLFTDDPSADTLDQMAQTVSSSTGRPVDRQSLIDQIIGLKSLRREAKNAFYREEKFRDQDERFQRSVVENRGSGKAKARPVVVDQLEKGQVFKARGEKFTVTKVDLDSVTLSDADRFGTQKVSSGKTVHIDKGTLRTPKESSVEPSHGPPDETSPSGSVSRETPQKALSSQVAPTPIQSQEQQLRLEKTRIVAQAANEWAAQQGIEFELQITPAVESGGVNEIGSRLGNVITAAENSDEKVLPHELAHIAFDGLPAPIKAVIERARQTAYKNAVESSQPVAPDERVAAGQMTSEEFKAAGLPIELYPFSSASEFLAHAIQNPFAQQALAAADASMIGRIRLVIAGLWRTIKRTLGLGNEMDRVVQDLIDGKLKFDPAIAAEQESNVRQSTFVTSADESINAANLASSAVEQKIEGESQLAQAADVTDVLDQFGVNTAGRLIQKAFDYGNWQTIRNTGEALNQGRENYRQMKTRLAADPFRRARLAGEGGQSILRFGEILDQVLTDAGEAFKKLTSRHFQDFIARVQAKAATAQAQQAILITSKSTFDSAIKEATAALKQEAKTDRDMAVLQGQIQGIREAAESTVAMEQTMSDMTATLATWPNLLTGEGGARAFQSEYQARKKAAGQPVTNPNLVKWASYILAKNPKLAAKVQAANLAQQTGLRAQLNGMAKQLASDFTKDPVATVRRSLRERERQVKNAMSAEFAFKQLEEELLSEMEPLIAAVDAGGIAARIKVDPQFQALRREILNDQTSWGGSPEPAKAMRSAEDAGSTITLPVVPGIAGAPPLPMSGATVGIGHEVLDGNVVTLRKRWDEHRKAITFLENWLANPLNADDPMRRYHAHNLDTLKNYYAGQQHLMPENQSPLWNRAYSIIGSAISKSGSRLVGQARSVLNRADQMHKWSRDWFDRTVHALPMTQRAAISSHGIKWNNLRGQSIVQANRIYQQKVGQELAASWARQQGGYNVGDTLSSGEVVTREDMAHLEAQAKAGFESIQLAAKYDEQITKDARGLRKTSNYRSALRTSPYLLPRMFDYQLQAKAKAVGDAVKAGSPGDIEAALNQLWPDIGMSILIDRNPEFSKRTIFDGKGNGFDVAANAMRSNPGAIPDIDTLANELARVSTLTPDQAKETVLSEFGRIVSQWSAAVEEKVEAAKSGGKSGDAKNSFTQARGDALAPWTFYRTGFTTTDDVSNHAAGMQSVALDRVTATLEAIKKDLERQKNDLDTKAKEFERLGKPNAIKSAIELKEIERRRGQTYDSWENLTERKANIDGVLAQLQTPSVSSTDFDLLFNRGAGALVGSLIGNIVTTMKNISSIFLGRQLRAAGMDEFNTTLRSALFTKGEAVKILASFGFVGVPKSIGYMLRGMAMGVPQLLKGNARQAYLGALRDVIRELSVNVPRRLKSVRELEASGLYQLPDKVAQFDNQILGSILYRGGIPANEFQGATKLGGYAAGLFEATLLAVANAGFPTIGDAAVNGAMHNAVNSRWGPVQGMEDSLRKVFVNWSKGGLPRTFNLTDPADPVNRLSPKELNLNEQTLSQVRRTYQMAGMSFDERAAAFMAELQTNPKAQFLTTENRNALTETLINKMNRSSFSNAPLRFKDGSFLSNMVRPLYGWSLRSFADWEESMAIPTNTESGRMKLWATSMALAAVALAMTGAGGQLQDELMARLLKRGLYNTESQNRLPWEEQSLGRGLAGVARLGMESVPLLGILGNVLIPANTPARASYEPTLVLWETGKSIVSWIYGMVATGDPMYGLPEIMAKFVPDSKIVLNRLESVAGRREGSNAVADIKRFADPDLVRPAYRGAIASGITEATPWKQRMDNAAYRGDRIGFRQAANEAVQANLRMGKKRPDAIKAVQSYWRSRNPETRALTRRMTPGEQREMMRRAAAFGKNHAVEIAQAHQNWARAGALIGVHQRQGGTNRVSLRAPSLSSRRGMARY